MVYRKRRNGRTLARFAGWLSSAAAVLLLATSVLAQDPQPAPAQAAPPLFKGSVSDLVVLPVAVTDKRGHLVTDLTEDAFAVYDNGQPQDVALFNKDDAPVSIALVIDDSGSMHQRLGQVVAATLAFARWSHPEDELLVIEFNDTVREALDGRWLAAADAAELGAALATLRPEGRTALYDALLDGLRHLAGAERARRVLVLVSDGGDNASQAALDDVLEQARRSNVAIYTIGLFDEASHDVNPGVLKRLAEATGGRRFLPRSPGVLLQACQEIAQEIRSSYTLGYQPKQHDGRYHRLRVTVDHDPRDLTVRSRPGYFAPLDPSENSDAAPR